MKAGRKLFLKNVLTFIIGVFGERSQLKVGYGHLLFTITS